MFYFRMPSRIFNFPTTLYFIKNFHTSYFPSNSAKYLVDHHLLHWKAEEWRRTFYRSKLCKFPIFLWQFTAYGQVTERATLLFLHTNHYKSYVILELSRLLNIFGECQLEVKIEPCTVLLWLI